MWDLYEGLPRLDTIRSWDEFSRVRHEMEGREANRDMEDRFSEERIERYFVFDGSTGELTLMSPEEYEKLKAKH
jgi:hypothetical protein